MISFMRHYEAYRRQTHRLVGYDYRLAGLYFITICTKNMEHAFGEVYDGRMELSDAGLMARDYWLAIPEHYPQISLHEFVVMPNHVHGILEIASFPAEVKALPIEKNLVEMNAYMANISPKAGSLSRVIGSYKAACTAAIRKMGTSDFAWQARFHDHIIRNPQSHERISQYILHNPQQWAEDRYCLS